MGQERSRKGKHVLLCIACCLGIFLWLCGCVHSVRQWQGEQALKEARDLRSTGNYSASEKKTLSVLEAFPQTLGDEALFQMGLIYSLPKNPNADYEKSKTFFEKLVTLYPDSGRKEEAAAWLFALTRMVGNEKETFELQKKVKTLEQASEARGKKLKQLQEELEAREKEIAEHRDAVSQLQGRVTELKSQLAKFKNIDLTIEQKKRGTAP
jgi:valyl-tRNA synthetase